MRGRKWPIALQTHKMLVVIPFSPLAIDETQCFPVGAITFLLACALLLSQFRHSYKFGGVQNDARQVESLNYQNTF